MRVNVNEILNGSGGDVWFNGMLLSTVQNVEAKLSGNFEDVEVCGEEQTYKKYNGWSGEGTLTMLKINSDIVKLVAEGYKSGVMPEIKIITAIRNKATGKAERCAIEGITVTEVMLAKFEKKTNVEEEFPFAFSDFEFLEVI